MGVQYLSISGVCTVLSFLGLQWWAQNLIEKFKLDGLIGESIVKSDNANHVLDLLLSSSTTVALLATFILSAFTLLVLSLKSIFFSELSSSETRKLLERLGNYLIYKGTFLPLVLPPTLFHFCLWSTWLTVLCSLKMFQALARDRLERLNASPSTTPWAYFRVYSVLLVVLTVDVFWIRLSLMIHKTLGSSMFLLLLFELFCVIFETLQAIVVHGFQLLDIWVNHSAGNSSGCRMFKFIDTSAAGALWEWKSFLIRNLGFVLDMATLLTAVGHYVLIWLLRGMPLHIVDVVLFLNIRALLSAIIKRVKGFIKLRTALATLHAALPDATSEELQAYDDECAICREPMAKAKRLHCRHLFHLGCLRSWLDQGLNDAYSCPTCRKPLFVSISENEASPSSEVLSDEQLARQLSVGLDGQNSSENVLPPGLFPSQTQNPMDEGTWRNAGLNSGWLNSWPSHGVDGAGPSSTAMRSVGLGRVQMMMRHLASIGDTYSQSALDDAGWGIWPTNLSHAGPSGSLASGAPTVGRHPGATGGLHLRTTLRSANDDIANILTMAETVREVLPHIPEEMIFQDLQRTNSVTVTVNNLLQI
ncbi:E3 ubiquitin protein ligase RIN2 [Eucalyptus grandis]|uniref:E3 ubiquitin protein ligase RIN2 n=1 Tax=Eucalyptus grandis TaxID=71139 RepID=UPI00192EAD3A|nr:E3 ubiquitin protein ligase RIN2 [Eucalyptus grandis]